MEVLSNETAVGLLISFVGILLLVLISIGIWLFKDLVASVKSLTKDVMNLTGVVNRLTDRTDDHGDDIIELRGAVFGTPVVKNLGRKGK